jgi:hypothetical protein
LYLTKTRENVPLRGNLDEEGVMDVFGVIAYHVIVTNYGFWLPNDPRGSWSDFVRSWKLFLAAGPATKTDTRRSVANKGHDYG